MLDSKYLDETLGITAEWVRSVGGKKRATDLIKEVLGCSESKARKLAGRRYPSKVMPLEEQAIRELTGATTLGTTKAS